MIKSLLITLLVACGLAVNAQQFVEKVNHPVSIGHIPDQLELADIDNDSLLDVIVSGQNSGKRLISFYKTAATPSLTAMPTLDPAMEQVSEILVEDFDGDNQLDLILSGTSDGESTTAVFINRGNFWFEKLLILPETAKHVRLSDLDADGSRELILSGDANGAATHIYSRVNNEWKLVNDSIRISANTILSFDFDKDGDNDLLLSGKDTLNKSKTMLYETRADFFLKPLKDSAAWQGKASVSDLNHDGYLDIAMIGSDDDGNARSAIYFHTAKGIVVRDTALLLDNARVFTGDFGNDGKVDVHTYGTTEASDTVNQFIYTDEVRVDLPYENLLLQAFGDVDRDGDLDVVQLKGTSTDSTLHLLENTMTPRNIGASPPPLGIGVKIFDRIFVFWQAGSDDKTPFRSLTYDVAVQSTGKTLIAPGFDLINLRRLTVSHGNNGTRNYLLLKAPEVTSFNYAVQSIDNAYHTRKSICRGGPGCQTTSFVELDACRNEQINLAASDNATWFSFAEGMLGAGASITKPISQSDTLFSVAINPVTHCVDLKVYTVKVREVLTRVDDFKRLACEGSSLRLSADPGLQASWSSSLRGFISNQQSIDYAVTAADTIKLKMTDGKGCTILERTAISISKPVLEAAPATSQILKGQAVQLMASGTGEAYAWMPPTGLSAANIAAPLANPTKTTTYVVTATDSLGCKASASVLVMVEETAFVPNLFTPNDDGKNDALRVYGLSTASNFNFSIQNRDGSVVYSTRSVNEATGSGWNGLTNGVRQPGGVYYWKVSGETQQGRAVLLNGKRSGSIVLVR